MAKIKYSSALITQVLDDLKATNDVALTSQKHGIPVHAIYRFRRDRARAPEISKDKKIKELSKELSDKDLEIKVLRELLKKTYQVMPIELP